MTSEADIALAEFYNWCGEILTGKNPNNDTEKKAVKAKGQRIVKAMINTGQRKTISEEFSKIHKLLISQG